MVNMKGLKCWYCGEQAENRDHVVSNELKIHKKKRKRLRAQAFEQFGRNTVPACKRCNVLKSDRTQSQFKADIIRCSQRQFYSSGRDMRLHRLAAILEPFVFAFYGERGAVDCFFPENPELSKAFRYKWKQRLQRGTGKQAVVIEECAKRGPFKEVQGGLVSQG